MWISKCKLDDRGRLTLPKFFLNANDLNKYTSVYIQTMYNTENTVKLVFVNDKESKDGQTKDNK